MEGSDSEPEVEYEPENFQIGPFEFSVMTVSFLPIELLMKNQSKGVEISGQKLWCGSLGVSEYIIRNSSYILDKRIIELGAGTGILGMLCSRLGANEVILTDYDPRSLTHMNLDVNRNNIIATILSLDWMAPNIEYLFQNSSNSLTHPTIILAGDVLYKRMLIEPFFRTVHLILSHIHSASPSTPPEMILCHVPRAGVEQSNVIQGAILQGLAIFTIPESEWKYSPSSSLQPTQEKNMEFGPLLSTCPREDAERAGLYRITLPLNP